MHHFWQLPTYSWHSVLELEYKEFKAALSQLTHLPHPCYLRVIAIYWRNVHEHRVSIVFRFHNYAHLYFARSCSTTSCCGTSILFMIFDGSLFTSRCLISLHTVYNSIFQCFRFPSMRELSYLVRTVLSTNPSSTVVLIVAAMDNKTRPLHWSTVVQILFIQRREPCHRCTSSGLHRLLTPFHKLLTPLLFER